MSGRVQLKAPGTYIIIPCAFKPKEEGDFILRIHLDEEIEIKWSIILIQIFVCFSRLIVDLLYSLSDRYKPNPTRNLKLNTVS